MFPYHSSQRNHCLHGCPSFALPLNPSLKCIYTLPLSTPFFHSVLLVTYYFIYFVDWTSERNVLVYTHFSMTDNACFPLLTIVVSLSQHPISFSLLFVSA
jgi:hypothetical protein